MPKEDTLYIDDEGVKRGYYVYFHKNKSTGEVFYIGKGSGDRAWDKTRRNKLWRSEVEKLSDGWDIEIIKRNLSENEAFYYEEKFIQSAGGSRAEGGGLTNWVPGGEHPSSLKIEIPIELSSDEQKNYESKIYKKYSRKEQEVIAESINKTLVSLTERLDELESEGDSDGNEMLSDSSSMAIIIFGHLPDVSDDFKRRRISWKDFCVDIEKSLAEIEDEMEYKDEVHEKVLSIYKSTNQFLKSIIKKLV